jgi:hypothetical protein
MHMAPIPQPEINHVKATLNEQVDASKYFIFHYNILQTDHAEATAARKAMQ